MPVWIWSRQTHDIYTVCSALPLLPRGFLPFELGNAWNGDPIVIEHEPASRVVDRRCCRNVRDHTREGSQSVSSSTVLCQAGRAVILAKNIAHPNWTIKVKSSLINPLQFTNYFLQLSMSTRVFSESSFQ